MFERCGQMAHVYEIKINRYIVKEENTLSNNKPGEVDDQELKVYIKPLSSDAAFNKGVEYFSEIFFFYGMLLALAVYELRRAAKSSDAQALKMKQYEEDIEVAKVQLTEVAEELRKSSQARVYNY